MKKRGQFFLIAALVIIVLLISAFAIYNTATAPPADSTVRSLSEEINFESAQIIDNGIFTGADRTAELSDLIEYYSESNPDSEIAILYGDLNSPTSVPEFLYYACEDIGDVSLAGSNLQSFCRTEKSYDNICYRSGIISASTGIRSSLADGEEGNLDPFNCFSEVDEGTRTILLPALNSNQVQLIFPTKAQYRIFESDAGESFFLVLRKNRGGEQIVQSNK